MLFFYCIVSFKIEEKIYINVFNLVFMRSWEIKIHGLEFEKENLSFLILISKYDIDIKPLPLSSGIYVEGEQEDPK